MGKPYKTFYVILDEILINHTIPLLWSRKIQMGEILTRCERELLIEGGDSSEQTKSSFNISLLHLGSKRKQLHIEISFSKRFYQ